MTSLITDVLHERAERAGAPDLDLDRLVAEGEARARRTRVTRVAGATGVGLLAAATVAAVVLAGATDGPTTSGEGPATPAGTTAPLSRSLSYAHDGDIVLPQHDVELDTGGVVTSYVPTDDGFVWSSEAGEVRFTPAAGGGSTQIGRVSRDGHYLASDDTGSLAAWIEPGKEPTLTVFDTAQGTTILRTGTDAPPDVSYFRDATDVVTVVGIDDGAVTWFNEDGLVRTDVATGETRRMGQAYALGVDDVGAGLLVSDASRDNGGSSASRVGPSLTDGLVVSHSGNAQISPDGSHVSFEDADELVVTDLATGEDVQPANPGYDYWVVSQWIDDGTFGGFGIRSLAELDNPRGADVVTLDFLTCEIPEGSCEVVAQDEIDVNSFAIPVGEDG